MPKSTYHFGDAPCTVRVNGYKMFLSNANVELGVISQIGKGVQSLEFTALDDTVHDVFGVEFRKLVNDIATELRLGERPKYILERHHGRILELSPSGREKLGDAVFSLVGEPDPTPAQMFKALKENVLALRQECERQALLAADANRAKEGWKVEALHHLEELNRVKALHEAALAAPVQQVSVPDGEDWSVFFGYLIDKCEGHIIAEENLQGWLSEMLADPHYCALFRREKTAAEQYSPIAMSIEAAEEEHGSLRAAAKALGIDHGYLYRLKSGEKINPGADVLKALGLERITYYRSMLNASPVQQDQAFCEYCGGNDEEPQDHCMDCTRPVQQVSVPDGWRLVPVELTREMAKAVGDLAERKWCYCLTAANVCEIFSTVLAAAPAAPAAEAGHVFYGMDGNHP